MDDFSKASRPGRLVLLTLAILVYVVLGAFIYRSWWIARGRASDLPADPATLQNQIRYDHYIYLGLQFYAKHDYRSAELSFRKSTRFGPDRPLAYNDIGSALNAQGKWDEAIPALEHALALDPGLAIARNNLEWAKAQRAKRSPTN